jgi:hypothetical protein
MRGFGQPDPITSSFADLPAFKQWLGRHRSAQYKTVVHMHGLRGESDHTLDDCYTHNIRQVSLTRPILFNVTVSGAGRFYGYVAADTDKPLIAAPIKKPVSYPRAKTTKYRNPELEKSHQLHEQLDQQLWERLQDED